MPRNVLADYLSSMRNERDFDAPFMALLTAKGFYDIHFTHGASEFGKDFIAKYNDSGTIVQYAFQSKCGDISQQDWRKSISQQVFEGANSSLSHPQFDASLAQQFVLVTTGRLSGNAALSVQDFNNIIASKFQSRNVLVWDQPTLIDYLAEFGSDGVYRATASGYTNYGAFFSLYGQAMQGQISTRQIGSYSHQWMKEPCAVNVRMLVTVLESETIAAKCKESGQGYEAIYSYLCSTKAVLDAIYTAQTDSKQREWLTNLYTQIVVALRIACEDYLRPIKKDWKPENHGLLEFIEDASVFVTYPVHCARIMEVTGLLYFLTEHSEVKSEIASFLNEFVLAEQGCRHPVSDYYAVSLVLATLALKRANYEETVYQLLRQTVVWLCDKYEDGFGLASMEATPEQEVSLLLGHPLESVGIEKRTQSFLATALCDLAAFANKEQLYTDIVNDLLAAGIVFQYWQVCDTRGQFSIEGDDVIQYLNIEFGDDFSAGVWAYAEHIRTEIRSFSMLEQVMPVGYAILALAIRGRYFPTIWPEMA